MLHGDKQVNHADTACHQDEPPHIVRHRHNLPAVPVDSLGKVACVLGRHVGTYLENLV